ncbi:zinc finger CCCH domain-containing protein 55-like isoform X2 [Magnolia sinica]|nr:zinc finger CCCH domain-containing protein 55-like isoform X2 [Magnolia sinica]XP_058097308.1 zinc finger CCCH domain-containing protein 55-like isoform X2 [Magnolia sinica]
MAENVRKRVSKWDLVPETHFSSETVQEIPLSGKAGNSCHEKESNSGWGSSKSSETHVTKSPDMEANMAVRSKDSSGASCWEHMPRSKNEGKDGNIDSDRGEISPTARICDRDQGYGMHMSPVLDAWGQQSRSHSPKSRWSRSRRSRSRSPPHGFKRERRDWNHSGGTGGSSAPCRDFSKGRCRRGSQCRFLHQDGYAYDGRRHYDGDPAEGRASRQDRGPGYAGDEAYSDSQEPSDYSRDKLSHGSGSRYDGDREKHDRQRNIRSLVRCNDFLKGKCYRGSTCKYVHHGDSTDGYGGWSSKEGARERAHDRRESDISFGHDQRREPPRNNDTPCKFFAEGRCYKGENCWFSHLGSVRGVPEGRSRDDGWSLSLGTEDPKLSDKAPDGNVCTSPRWGGPENEPWGGPTWGDKGSDNDVANSPQWGHNSSAIGVPEKNRLWEGPKLGIDEASDKNISTPPRWKSNEINARGDAPESGLPESSDTEIFLDATGVPPTGTNREGFPHHMDSQEPIHNPQDSRSRNPEEDIKHQILPKEVPDINLPACEQNTNPEVSGKQPQHALEIPMQPEVSENSYIQQHPGLKADGQVLLPCDDRNKVTNSNKPHNDIDSANNFPANISAPGQCFNENGHRRQIVPPPLPSVVQSSFPNGQSQWLDFPSPNSENFNPSAHTQQTVLPPSDRQNFYPSGHSQQIVFPPPNGQNFNPNSQQMIPQPPSSVCPQTMLGQDESTKRPGVPDVNMLPVASETPIARNTASEQFSQITDISASLAQIFGNGPHLPQLYASLSNLSAAGLVPSLPYSQSKNMQPPAPTAAPSIQPNQRSWPQNQYDPLCNSMEPVNLDINDHPLGVLSNSFDQKTTGCIEESQAPLKSMVPLPATSGHNDGDPHGSGGPEEKLHQENQKNMDSMAKEVNEETNGQSEKEQQTGHLKDMDADDAQVDEESKRSKDGKGMRMFRFSLVEFVKELLKPTWKEGHMSKEAHKAVVKKVVEKVTGAMQGPLIPQTQEKIDHYLSSSKPKLTKLVQAYVEKYLKT